MYNKGIILISILAGLLLFSCNNKTYTASRDVEYRQLDTMVITAKKPNRLKSKKEFQLPKSNPSEKRNHDLIHTVLELSFDWQNEFVNGRASLTLSPYFYPSDQVVLDAKGFDIHKIDLGPRELEFDYDGNKLTIQLGTTYEKGEEFIVGIDYTAKPAESSGGGSAAIMSDQGLFFINNDGADPAKPMQIWTQGETEWNSRWFPTIDKPNERCTQEMYLTVADNFKTLSNGILVSSTKNNDGTRTDYWKMELPHAPYLFMMAIGEYAVVKETWRGIPVEYYVEPEYEEHAKAIFANTLEMLDFFSDKLGVKYPWSKYAQVVVRDFVSGAMENTTGTIFGEFVQRTERELLDGNNDRIVAHELFHHWFGDLVTCESWANLTMNEGFANYAEYLWYEHKYGREAADYHWLEESRGYFGEAMSSIHPLIYFGYRDKEDMFDAHSYNKGGCIIHMLRNYVGDDAFWASLNNYLTENQYNSVESHDLRLAFEEVTGEDLNWFFDQWFFKAGHPVLSISNYYDPESKVLNLYLEQTQNVDNCPPVYRLPMTVDFYLPDGEVVRKNIWMDQRVQEYQVKLKAEPIFVNVDAERVLLMEREEEKSIEEYTTQYELGKKFMDRYEALESLTEQNRSFDLDIFKAALKDKSWAIRGLAVESVYLEDDGILKALKEMASNDEKPQVRAAAIKALSDTKDDQYAQVFKNAISNDKSYAVISSALESLVQVDEKEALDFVSKVDNIDNEEIINAIGYIYLDSGNSEYLEYFTRNLNKVDGYTALDFIANYLQLAVKSNKLTESNAVAILRELALDKGQSMWRKFGATKSLSDLMNFYRRQANDTKETLAKNKYQLLANEIQSTFEEIKRKETNSMLNDLYDQL